VHSVEEVVAGGLCIGCGLCESLAPDKIEMVMTAEGRERPRVRRPLTAPTWRRIEAACPGTRIVGVPPASVPAGASVDPVWGPVIRLVEAHAADPDVRYRASSGGVLTALGQYLLESGRVEAIVHVAASRDAPMRSTGQVSFDHAQVLEGAGSRYGPAAPLRDLMAIVEEGRPFALIGKPCDVGAVRSLARTEPRLASQLRYVLAMLCGGASDLEKSRAVLTQFGLQESELSLFRYRGYGSPGLNRIQTHDGRNETVTYEEMWSDEAGWRIQSRCKVCPDAIGEVADIVAGDMWPGGDPPDNDDGYNAVFVRTDVGAELLESAVAAGVLEVGDVIPVRRMDYFQPHQVEKKRAVASRLAGMRAAGAPVPRVRDLRIGRLARQTGWRAAFRQFLGAYRRARRGAFSEPVANGHAQPLPVPRGPRYGIGRTRPDPSSPDGRSG
jgi:coenzyme F420 hydrogenase subunit beta